MTLQTRTPNRSLARGFSLIEVMISMLMAAMLTVVMGNVFIASQVTRKAQDALSEVQNNGRIAISWLAYVRTYVQDPFKVTNQSNRSSSNDPGDYE